MPRHFAKKKEVVSFSICIKTGLALSWRMGFNSNNDSIRKVWVIKVVLVMRRTVSDISVEC
jgi:hypothetical protein